MARFIIDVPSDYNSNKEIVFNKLSLKDFTEKLQSACDFITNDSSSFVCVEEHNTGQFYTNPVYNKLTSKQVRTFNDIITK